MCAGMEELETLSGGETLQQPTSTDTIRDTITDKKGEGGSGKSAHNDEVVHFFTRYNTQITGNVLTIKCV